MAWGSSNRRASLPADWKTRRVAILRRDNYCCVLCGNKASDVDHIDPGGSDEPENLRSLCGECHGRKSSAEGHAALRRLRAMTKRKPEEVPGAIPPERAVPRKNVGF